MSDRTFATPRWTEEELGSAAVAWNELRRQIADDYADADVQAFEKWAEWDDLADGAGQSGEQTLALDGAVLRVPFLRLAAQSSDASAHDRLDDVLRAEVDGREKTVTFVFRAPARRAVLEVGGRIFKEVENATDGVRITVNASDVVANPEKHPAEWVYAPDVRWQLTRA